MPFDYAPSSEKSPLQENKTQHHVCLSVCSLMLGFMLHLRCCSPFQLAGVSAQLLDCPVLTQEVKNASAGLWAPSKQSCSSFLQTPDNPKRGVREIKRDNNLLLSCWGLAETSWQDWWLTWKKKQEWLMLGLVTFATCKSAKDSEFGTSAPENPNISTLCMPQLVLPSAPPLLPWPKQHIVSIPPLCSSSIPSKSICTSGSHPCRADISPFVCLALAQGILEAVTPHSQWCRAGQEPAAPKQEGQAKAWQWKLVGKA